MENWRKVWRDGLAPLLSTSGLEALYEALVKDDDRLVQRATCHPPPAVIFESAAVEAACALGFCGWRGEGLDTVGQVEAFFIRTCLAADEALGEPAGCRHFLNWFDDTSRADMRCQLLSEVKRTLNHRYSLAA